MNHPPLREAAQVIVVGSVNMDIVVRVKALPAPGETVAGDDAELLLGGKGANQAIAAHRLGAKVQFLARIGDDAFGNAALRLIETEKLDIKHIHGSKGLSTGIAMITVGGQGQNMISLSPGANAHLGPQDVEGLVAAFTSRSVLLLQNEVPVSVSRQAAMAMRREGGLTILDPAPAAGFELSLLSCVDIVTPNETEAEALTGVAVLDRETALVAARMLVKAGARAAIVKMGAAGVVFAGVYGEGQMASPQVEAVDTVAAGDCFNGALAVAMGEGRNFQDAIDFACRAAAISVTRKGASASMPYRDQLESMQSSWLMPV